MGANHETAERATPAISRGAAPRWRRERQSGARFWVSNARDFVGVTRRDCVSLSASAALGFRAQSDQPAMTKDRRRD
jgi:hypothetical protein